MSDYMFMLESHLSPAQNAVVGEVLAMAAETNSSLFLTGGAMRDMLGGFPIRDLDFTVEGNALKFSKLLAQKTGAAILATDENRKTSEMRFQAGVMASIGMSRQERFSKAGGRPQVTPASIHEDLRCRDFTVNAIALSLNRASRGLLLDPTNGLADIDRRELRAAGNYALYDDPIRILRLIRLKARLGYAIEERTQSQYRNVREAGLELKIPPAGLYAEMRHMADEPNVGELLRVLDEEKLLTLFSAAMSGAKLNLPGFAKLLKAQQIVPFGVDLHLDNLGLFLYLFTEKLTPKERAGLIDATALSADDIALWQKLEARAKKLEKDLQTTKLQRPSLLYQLLSKSAGDQILFLLVRSQQRLVQDRLRNYLQKYLPAAQEVTDEEVVASGVDRQSGKFQKAKEDLISARLDARPKKVPLEQIPEPAPVATPARGRSFGG